MLPKRPHDGVKLALAGKNAKTARGSHTLFSSLERRHQGTQLTAAIRSRFLTKLAIRDYLENHDYLNAVLYCEQNFLKTAPVIRLPDLPVEFFEESREHAPVRIIPDETKESVNRQFQTLINAYSGSNPPRLEYIEYARLGQAIIVNMLVLRLFELLVDLIEKGSIFAGMLFAEYIDYYYPEDLSHAEIQEINRLCGIFSQKINDAAKNSGTFYYLYVKCRNKLQLPVDIEFRHAAHHVLIPFEQSYIHLADAEREYSQVDDEADEEVPGHIFYLFYQAARLGNPLSCLFCLDLDWSNKDRQFWLQLGVLQGHTWAASTSIRMIMEDLFSIIFNQIIDEAKAAAIYHVQHLSQYKLITSNAGELEKFLTAAAEDEPPFFQRFRILVAASPAILALHNICKFSEAELAELLDHISRAPGPVLFPGLRNSL